MLTMHDWFADIARKVADKPICDVAGVAGVARPKKARKFAAFGEQRPVTSRMSSRLLFFASLVERGHSSVVRSPLDALLCIKIALAIA
jgi:hypothetical protein